MAHTYSQDKYGLRNRLFIVNKVVNKMKLMLLHSFSWKEILSFVVFICTSPCYEKQSWFQALQVFSPETEKEFCCRHICIVNIILGKTKFMVFLPSWKDFSSWNAFYHTPEATQVLHELCVNVVYIEEGYLWCRLNCNTFLYIHVIILSLFSWSEAYVIVIKLVSVVLLQDTDKQCVLSLNRDILAEIRNFRQDINGLDESSQ